MLIDQVSRTMNAVRFVQQQSNSLWLVLAKTSAWSTPYTDLAPPPDDPTLTGLDTPICAIKASCVMAYRDDVNGTVEYDDADGNTEKYVLVSDIPTAISMGLTDVILQADTPGSNIVALGVSFYRQAAFYTNLVPATGFSSAIFLAAANISSYGNIETIENSSPEPVSSSRQYDYGFIYQY